MGASIDEELPPALHCWRPMAHAAALRSLDAIEWVAVCSLTEARARSVQARFSVARCYIDFERMLVTERPELLCIATPPEAHCAMIEIAARAGVRAIYCEKPLVKNLAEADRIVALCKEHDVSFNYGAQRRYMEPYRTLQRALQSEKYGRLTSITIRCPPSPLYHIHSHSIDLLLFLIGGAPESVDARLFDPNAPDPVVLSARLGFANGVEAHIAEGGGYQVDLQTTELLLQVENNGAEVWLTRGARERLDFPPIRSGTAAGIEELVAALRGGSPTTGMVEGARLGMSVLQAMRY